MMFVRPIVWWCRPDDSYCSHLFGCWLLLMPSVCLFIYYNLRFWLACGLLWLGSENATICVFVVRCSISFSFVVVRGGECFPAASRNNAPQWLILIVFDLFYYDDAQTYFSSSLQKARERESRDERTTKTSVGWWFERIVPRATIESSLLVDNRAAFFFANQNRKRHFRVSVQPWMTSDDCMECTRVYCTSSCFRKCCFESVRLFDVTINVCVFGVRYEL